MPAPIQPGMRYPTFDALKIEIQNWAIANHFSFVIPRKDQLRADYRCRARQDGCPWRVYASLSRDGDVIVKILENKHTCIGLGPVIREVANMQTWLRRVIPLHLFVTRGTRTEEVIDCIRIHYNATVTPKAARLVRSFLVADRLEHQREQFQKIPAYLVMLQHFNPYVHAHLKTISDFTGQDAFQRVFICPIESQLSYIQMRPFIAVDGTFLKARFIQTLLLAVGIDGNGQILLLAWAVVESENTESWTWFLTCLRNAIPQILSTTLISDRDKGLLAAEKILGVHVTRAICCFHLKENFVKRYTRALEHLFWSLANSKTHDEYASRMSKLRDINSQAADYLTAIDASLWVTAYYTGPTFGHKTSNIVEAMNKVLKSERELSILDLLNELWHLTMKYRFDRLTLANNLLSKNQKITDFALKKLAESQKWAAKNIVRMATEYRGEVSQANDRVYVVDLDTRRCDCGNFQENGIPCGHAFSCILSLKKSPRDYVPSVFSIETWKNTYTSNFHPVSLNNLERHPNAPIQPFLLQSSADPELQPAPIPLPQCNPPDKRRAPIGRPRIKRLTAETKKKRVTQAQATLNGVVPSISRGPGSQCCGICGKQGHKRTTCTQSV